MFGWSVARVAGESMAPSLEHGDFVLSRCATPEIGDVVLIRHGVLGLIVKRISGWTDLGYWTVASDNTLLMCSEAFGPIARDEVAGVVRWRVAPGRLCRMRRVIGQDVPLPPARADHILM